MSGDDLPLFPAADPSGDAYLFPGPPGPGRRPRKLPPVARVGRRVVLGAEPEEDPRQSGPPGGDTAVNLIPPRPEGRRPPPMPTRPGATAVRPGSGGAAAPPAPNGTFVGVVVGPVVTTTARRCFWGLHGLIGAATIATAAVVGRSLSGAVAGPLLAVGLVGPAVLVAVVAVFSWIGVRGPGGAGAVAHVSLAVCRFRVQPVAGDPRSFLVEGDLAGGAPREGDIVRVACRRERAEHVVVRELEFLATLSGPVVRAVVVRPGRRHTAARLVSVAGFACAAVLLSGVAVLLSGFVD